MTPTQILSIHVAIRVYSIRLSIPVLHYGHPNSNPNTNPNLTVFLKQQVVKVHRVSKNVPPLACYNFDTHMNGL